MTDTFGDVAAETPAASGHASREVPNSGFPLHLLRRRHARSRLFLLPSEHLLMPTLVRHWLAWKWYFDVHPADRAAAVIGLLLLAVGTLWAL
jgi:hypothetical protein